MSAVERARQDVADGRLWKGRDRLLGAAVARSDDELLGLLGEIQFAMHDLPAAGAAWFPTGRADDDARRADEAWRERHGRDPLQLWLSLPGAARYREDPRCRELRDVACRPVRPGVPRSARAEPEVTSGPSVAAMAGIGLAMVVATCLVVGAWTILRWVLP